MARNRYDETWHRLREWTNEQAPSERLAAQILIHEGFQDFDPSHPLGGKDGGKDGIASKKGMRFAMAVYFPRGQQSLNTIKGKFEGDLAGARRNSAEGIAFVTNQELTLSEREDIETLALPIAVELYHLERITTILDAPSMAKVREQFLNIEAESPPAIQLGGRGGAGLGAGGGGGGAIGENATGGSGGSGGAIDLRGTPGEAPGAGGGGAGAVGEDAVGGEGGGGGEYLSGILGPDDIGPDSGFHHFEIRVGKGGAEGPGEDTILNLCDIDGRVLRSMVTKGGKAGTAPYLSPLNRVPAGKESEAGLKVIGILAAAFIRGKDGLWTIVDGGWDWVQASSNPFRVTLPLFVEVGTGTLEPGTVLDVKFVVRSPDGFQVHEQRHDVPVLGSLVKRSRFAVTLEFSGSQSGLWYVQILAGCQVVGEFPIEVRAPAPA
jgi:hypothetical protein